MRKIALIGCCKRKQGKNEPNKLFFAKDIYIGNSFKKSKEQGIVKFECEDYFISQKEINPYFIIIIFKYILYFCWEKLL